MELAEWNRLERNVEWNREAITLTDEILDALDTIGAGTGVGYADEYRTRLLTQVTHDREGFEADLVECERRLGRAVHVHAPGALRPVPDQEG